MEAQGNSIKNEKLVHMKFISSQYSNQPSTLDNFSIKAQNKSKERAINVSSSKGALEKIIVMNSQLPQINSQRPSLFGNAILQQNLMSPETNQPIEDPNAQNQHDKSKTQIRYVQGNPAKALRNKVKNDTYDGFSSNTSVNVSASKRPQSSVPQRDLLMNLQATKMQVEKLSIKEKSFNQSQSVIGQQLSASIIPQSDGLKLVGQSQRSNESSNLNAQLPPHPQFFDRRRTNPSRQLSGIQAQYNTSNLSNTSSNLKQLIQSSFNEPQKKQEGIQMLPSTTKQYLNTKREYFGRRMSSIDKPIIVITFQGVIGDFIKTQLLLGSKDQEQQPPIPNLNIRIGSIQGLKFLSKHFQLVVINNHDPQSLVTQNEIVERIQTFLNQNEIIIDAIYSIMKDPKDQVQMCENYSQIYIDFNLNSLKKVQERVLFIQSLDLDWMGYQEQLKLDNQGYFMFDYSITPPKPLITGLPMTLSYPNSIKIDNQKQSKTQPLVLIVPNFRSSYQTQATGLSFISIVKSIMTVCSLSMQKSKVPLSELSKLTDTKEWDIRLSQNMICFNIQKSQNEPLEYSNIKDEDYDTTCTSSQQTSIEHKLQKQMKSFHNLVQQNSFEVSQQQIRSPSVHSEERDTKLKDNLNDTTQLVWHLNDQFFSNVEWTRFIQLQDQFQASIFDIKLVQSDLVFRFYKHQMKIKQQLNQEKEQRIQSLRMMKQVSLTIPTVTSNQTNSQKVFSDIYDILKDQRTNGNPLSNMMNRNLRVFENVKADVKKQIGKQLSEWDKEQQDRQKQKSSKVNLSDLENLEVVNRFIVIGFQDPQSHFKTLLQCFEKYQGPQQTNYESLRNGELDIEVDNRKISLLKWLKMNSNSHRATSKQRDRSTNSGGRRPSSVSSAGPLHNNGQVSSRSFGESHATINTFMVNITGPTEEKLFSYLHQNFSPNSETITVTVIPCGREDGKNSEEEMPYEMKIRKKVNENSLKEIFSRKNSLWEKIFKSHLDPNSAPNFSIYRKPFEYEQDPSKSELFLHILYMKSSEKALTRNYNAQELELFCHNRFYGPLVVAYNLNKQPYFLCDFSLNDLTNIEAINRNFQNKSIKDDYVPECLIDFDSLRQDLDKIYKDGSMEPYTFYMFKYKSAWCPNKKDSHDSKSCIYAHHMRDFRRPPEIFKYLPEDCDTLIKGIGWDKCEKGLKCNKCHTTVERLYHPDKYKRIFCDVRNISNYKFQRSRCNKSEICAFYHSHKERQQANRECKNYRRSIDQRSLPDIAELHDKMLEFYRLQSQQQHSQSFSHSQLNEEAKRGSQRDRSESSSKSQTYEDVKVVSFEFNDIYSNKGKSQSNESLDQVQVNVHLNGNHSNLDKSSPLFQPSYRPQQSQQMMNLQHQGQPNYYMMSQPTYPQNLQVSQPLNIIHHIQMQQHQSNHMAQQQMMHQQVSSMQKIQLIQNGNTQPMIQQNQTQAYHHSYSPEDRSNMLKLQREQFKMQMNYFDYYEHEDGKTRNSTFSKASDGREEIKKSVVTFQAFIQDQNSISFLNPVDDDGHQSPIGGLNRQPSGKSPSNFASPIILDFLEDDNFFQVEETRVKSKTEFVKRERQESEDSNQDDFQLPGDAQEYLNSILPNNSIKFKKHSQSVSITPTLTFAAVLILEPEEKVNLQIEGAAFSGLLMNFSCLNLQYIKLMGGKKKPAKKGKGGEDDKYDAAQMTIILGAQVQSLKERLVLEQERKDKSRSVEESIRQHEREMIQELEDQQKKTRQIVTEMTEQYKRMEKLQQDQINEKRAHVEAQEDQISKLKHDLAKLQSDKEIMIREKDNEIKELKKRIDEMSSDFAEMLKDTLTKMQERIEFANKQWEDDKDANMLQKFQEMAAGR